MYEAMILDLRERLENFPADGFSLDYCRIRGACEAMEAMNEKLAALQSENVEKDREIERLRLQRPVQVDGNVMALALELAETKAALSRVEAERDAAQKCIYDVETYLELGSGAYIVKTIQAWKNGAQGEG